MDPLSGLLDDILLDDSGLVEFGEGSSNYMLMGRFGNVPLVNGEPRYVLAVEDGEVRLRHAVGIGGPSCRKAD